MPSEFQYDVFLSHSANDKEVVRPLVERLRQDEPNVWPVTTVMAVTVMRVRVAGCLAAASVAWPCPQNQLEPA